MKHSPFLHWLALIACFASASSDAAEFQPPSAAHVHTYSIVARDPTTGQLGVAAQSHYFSVGTVVAWAEAGVGAVATQAFAEPGYGNLGLALMRAGRSSTDTLKSLLAGDEGRDVRQVAMIDSRGRVATHTGGRNIAEAGHVVGESYSVQGNFMLSDAVWPAMARAFEATKGPLAERLLAALDAGQNAGGDVRGKQSAVLLVVSGTPTGNSWTDRLIDLRVDDAAEPLHELRRLLVLRRAYDHIEAARQAQRRGENDLALAEYRAASALQPENAEFRFWHAIALVRMKRIEDALPLFRRVYSQDRNWARLPPRLAKSGFLPDDEALLKRIVEAGQ
jgi:uncharacterized Ntn-hydrolase superfamily protein